MFGFGLNEGFSGGYCTDISRGLVVIGAWRRGVDGGSLGVYMAQNLLAASVVEAAGESSRLALLYLQHYATGVYKGVCRHAKGHMQGRTSCGKPPMYT